MIRAEKAVFHAKILFLQFFCYIDLSTRTKANGGYKMKKFFILLTTLALMLSLAACGEKAGAPAACVLCTGSHIEVYSRATGPCR